MLQATERSWIEATFQKRECSKFIPSADDEHKYVIFMIFLFFKYFNKINLYLIFTFIIIINYNIIMSNIC